MGGGEAPPGCADPGIVYAWMVGGSVMPDYDYLIIPVYCAGENDVLWEYSGGQWTCREQEGMTRIASTMALRDGRVFLLGADDGSAVLYEFSPIMEEINAVDGCHADVPEAVVRCVAVSQRQYVFR
jgi:hypothetical protein